MYCISILEYALLLGVVTAIADSSSAAPSNTDYSAVTSTLPPESSYPTSSTSPSPYEPPYTSSSHTYSDYTSVISHYTASSYPTPVTDHPPHHTGDCGDNCGGVCGDHKVQYPEECDLGPKLNGAPGSGCTSDCKHCPICGDGIKEGMEECDLGHLNGADNSGCSSTCCTLPVCGNGIVEEGESCDKGDQNGVPGSGCDSKCQKCGYCGDGIVEANLGESCDLGPLNGGWNSGCSKNCTWVPVCGNGKKEDGEECDAGAANGAYNSGCSKDCKLCGYCGDGIIDHGNGETCDNGWQLNGTPGNPCSENCTMTSCDCHSCGNGILDPGEQCDHGADHNGQKGDSCTSDCKWVTCSCGDGVTQYPEECDDGEDLNGGPYSHCSKNCTLIEPCGNPHPPHCGDGVVQYPELCDLGWWNGQPGSNCTSDCKPCNEEPARCGDNHIDPELGETCDDGVNNNTPGSNCDEFCHWKSTSTCPQTCNPNPFFNKCHITSSCINTPSGNDYCACRAGYRADHLEPNDHRQFRLHFVGQEYRVFVEPGVSCDTLCTSPFPGPDSCREVPVKDNC